MVSPEPDADGNPISVLSPWLWETGVIYVFIALVMAEPRARVRPVLRAAGASRSRSARSLVDVAPPALLIWLAANDRVVNPAFIEAIGWAPEPPTSGSTVASSSLGILSILSTVIEEIDRARHR